MQLAKHVMINRVEGGAIVLNAATGSYFQLNESGYVILDQICSGATIAEIVDDIGSSAAVPEDRVAKDVRDFVLNLLRAGFLKECVG